MGTDEEGGTSDSSARSGGWEGNVRTTRRSFVSKVESDGDWWEVWKQTNHNPGKEGRTNVHPCRSNEPDPMRQINW